MDNEAQEGQGVPYTGSVARNALIKQVEDAAEKIEASKGQTRCEAHPHMAQGQSLSLLCLAELLKGDNEKYAQTGGVKRRVAAMVASWAICSVLTAGTLVLCASYVVGFQWKAILEKLLP